MTAKKCTKRRDTSAELLFCQSKLIAVLLFSLASPSSLLKLPFGGWRPVTHCLHVISFRQKLPSYKLSYERKPLRFVIGCCCCCCCCYCVRVFLINCTLVSSTLKTITSFIYRPRQKQKNTRLYLPTLVV